MRKKLTPLQLAQCLELAVPRSPRSLSAADRLSSCVYLAGDGDDKENLSNFQKNVRRTQLQLNLRERRIQLPTQAKQFQSGYFQYEGRVGRTTSLAELKEGGLNSITQELRKLSRKIEKQQVQIDVLKASDNLQTHKHELKSQSQQAQCLQVASLQNQMQSLRRELSEAHLAMQSAARAEVNLARQLEDMRAGHDRQSQLAGQHWNQICQLKAQWSREVEGLRVQLQSARQGSHQGKRAAEQCKLLQELVSQMKISIQHKEKQLAAVRSSEAQARRLAEEQDRLQERLRSGVDLTLRLQNQLQSMRAELEQHKFESVRLQQQNCDLRFKQKQMVGLLENARRKEEELQGRLLAHTRQLTGARLQVLQKERSVIGQEREVWRKTAGQYCTRISLLEDSMNQAHLVIQRLKAEGGRKGQAERESLRQQLEDLKQESSKRVKILQQRLFQSEQQNSAYLSARMKEFQGMLQEAQQNKEALAVAKKQLESGRWEASRLRAENQQLEGRIRQLLSERESGRSQKQPSQKDQYISEREQIYKKAGLIIRQDEELADPHYEIRLNALVKDCEQKQRQLAKCKQELWGLAQELHSARQSASQALLRLEQQKAVTLAAKSQLNEIRANPSSQATVVSRLQNRIAALQKQNVQLRQSERYRSRGRSLTQQPLAPGSNLEQLVSRFKDKITALEQQLEQQRQKVARQDQMKYQHKERASFLEQQVANRNMNEKRLGEQVHRLKSRNTYLQQQLSALKTSEQASCKLLKERILLLQQQQSYQRGNRPEEQALVRRLQGQVCYLQEQLNICNQRLGRGAEQTNHLQNRTFGLQQQLAASKAECLTALERLSQYIQQTEHLRQQLFNSQSLVSQPRELRDQPCQTSDDQPALKQLHLVERPVVVKQQEEKLSLQVEVLRHQLMSMSEKLRETQEECQAERGRRTQAEQLVEGLRREQLKSAQLQSQLAMQKEVLLLQMQHTQFYRQVARQLQQDKQRQELSRGVSPQTKRVDLEAELQSAEREKLSYKQELLRLRQQYGQQSRALEESRQLQTMTNKEIQSLQRQLLQLKEGLSPALEQQRSSALPQTIKLLPLDCCGDKEAGRTQFQRMVQKLRLQNKRLSEMLVSKARANF